MTFIGTLSIQVSRDLRVSTGKVPIQWKTDLMILNTSGGALAKMVVKVRGQGIAYTIYTRAQTITWTTLKNIISLLSEAN